MSTRDPRAALAWVRAGHSIRIKAINLRDVLRHVEAMRRAA